MLEFLGLFQCFLELAGSVVLYEFDLLGDVGLLHLDVYDWVDYDLVEVGVFMSPGVVDTRAHLGVGNMWVFLSGLAKFVQALLTKPLPHIIRHFDYLT